MKTSYFAKSGNNPDAVSIASKSPLWFTGKSYPPLAPPWRLVVSYQKGEIDKYQYEEVYNKQLNNLNALKVREDLGDNAVLLCWEAKGFCHRHLVANWLKKFGIEVDEL